MLYAAAGAGTARRTALTRVHAPELGEAWHKLWETFTPLVLGVRKC